MLICGFCSKDNLISIETDELSTSGKGTNFNKSIPKVKVCMHCASLGQVRHKTVCLRCFLIPFFMVIFVDDWKEFASYL
jgi:ribosomal protein L40E